jgi:transposase-like protein
MDEAKAWQARALDALYPIVYLDCVHVKARDAGAVTIVKSWRSNWARITPFFEYPPQIRRIIYTTNAIESVNMSLHKITKNRGSFPPVMMRC